MGTLGDQITVKAVYSRSEKSSKVLAASAESTLGSDAIDPSAYHDTGLQISADVLLARPDIDAAIVILLITKQPEVVLKALTAGKHVSSEKPIAEGVLTGIGPIRK